MSAGRAPPPTGTSPSPSIPWFEAVASRMPVPFRGAGPGSLPRYHGEIGPFVALAAGGSLPARAADSTTSTAEVQLIDSLSLGLRVGLGLEELLTDSGDGLIFLRAASP